MIRAALVALILLAVFKEPFGHEILRASDNRDFINLDIAKGERGFDGLRAVCGIQENVEIKGVTEDIPPCQMAPNTEVGLVLGEGFDDLLKSRFLIGFYTVHAPTYFEFPPRSPAGTMLMAPFSTCVVIRSFACPMK